MSGVPSWGVFIIRIIIFCGLYGDPPILGNSMKQPCNPKPKTCGTLDAEVAWGGQQSKLLGVTECNHPDLLRWAKRNSGLWMVWVLWWGYIGIMEKQMEATIVYKAVQGLRLRVWGLETSPRKRSRHPGSR